MAHFVVKYPDGYKAEYQCENVKRIEDARIFNSSESAVNFSRVRQWDSKDSEEEYERLEALVCSTYQEWYKRYNNLANDFRDKHRPLKLPEGTIIIPVEVR